MRMKMTLSKFIKSGGIPPDDMFYLYHPQVFDGMQDCASNKAFLNRTFEGGALTRLLRKLYYERGIGQIPVDASSFEAELLFWGVYDHGIMLPSIRSMFDQLGRKSSRKHVVVVGATDDSFSKSYVPLIPKQVEKVFVLNCVVDHSKVEWYPLGRDGTGADCFKLAPRSVKRLKAYCNFSPDTHPDRGAILNMVEDRSFVTYVDVKGYGLYTGYPLSNIEFLEQLNAHAFCICPRGAGFDTFRLWDSLHLGVVPIVVKESAFHDNLVDLPILFLDSVDDFATLNKSFLRKQYEKMLETEYDFSVLTANYWRERFHESTDCGQQAV